MVERCATQNVSFGGKATVPRFPLFLVIIGDVDKPIAMTFETILLPIYSQISKSMDSAIELFVSTTLSVEDTWNEQHKKNLVPWEHIFVLFAHMVANIAFSSMMDSVLMSHILISHDFIFGFCVIIITSTIFSFQDPLISRIY